MQKFKKAYLIAASVLALFTLVVILSPDQPKDDTQANASTSQETPEEPAKSETKEDVAPAEESVLPKVDEGAYAGKEGLVVFKELSTKGYSVTAKYENERLLAASRDMTEAFESADLDKCEDRLGFDAYIVSKVSQDGKNISLVLGNEPNNNQTCPDGSIYNG